MMIAELALVARRHLTKLTLDEHRQLVVLLGKSHGRPDRNLTPGERDQLLAMVRKLEPGQLGKSMLGAVRNPSKNPLRRSI
jgi:uncharacterized SAM-dependent methyltransferase